MMSGFRQLYRIIILFLISFSFFSVESIRLFPNEKPLDASSEFIEAPAYQNGKECSVLAKNRLLLSCDPSAIHIAMTLDPAYLRGTVSAVHSILKHTSCPENIFFHFIASASNSFLSQTLSFVFPSLSFKVYAFDETRVKNLISSSIRQALDSPLNYARSYLADILSPCVQRVIYLDSDVIVVDDIQKLWKISLSGSRTIGAPEYCHANFTKYFSDRFWTNQELSSTFAGKKPCYFNTGVMVIDLERWREGDYTRNIEKWMKIQKERRIYELGSLPPFLLVFAGDIEGIDHQWNQHGLGGDNVVSSCRSLHPGPVSLIHWSGKGKPWVRLDEGRPCPIDYLWAPYDLHNSQGQYLQHNQEPEIL